MHQRDVTVPNWVLAVLWYPSLRLPSLQRSYRPRPLQKTWTREGLNPPRGGPFHVNGSLQWMGGGVRSDRSLPVAKDCHQYIPKGNPTPASKLAFVNNVRWCCRFGRSPVLRGLEQQPGTCFMVFNHMASVTFFRRPRLSVSYTWRLSEKVAQTTEERLQNRRKQVEKGSPFENS